MTRRDFWLGVVVIVAAILTHTAFPRYEWRQSTIKTTTPAMIRIDQWFGTWSFQGPTREPLRVVEFKPD